MQTFPRPQSVHRPYVLLLLVAPALVGVGLASGLASGLAGPRELEGAREATSQSVVAPKPQAAAEPASEALLRGLANVSVDEMKSDLYFIASDEMKGRDTPSPEQRIVARYIRARLQRLGFEPGGRDGSFLYEYKWGQTGLDTANMGVTLHVDGRTQQLTWGEDYFLAQRAFGKRSVEGDLVWCGALDDAGLDGIDVKGKWIVGRPDERMPSGRRLSALEAAGAVGVVALPFGDVEKQVSDLSRINIWYTGMRLSRGDAADRAVFPLVHLAPRAAAIIERALGDDTVPGTVLPIHMRETCDYGKRDDAVLENVCGFWPGSDPVLKDEVILLSAHYDHVGVRASDGEVFNGADDNGSGTTGLLALAQALKAYGPMRRSVMLIWVSGEEKGLYGSQAWTEDPSLPKGTRPLCNINIDMIGRNAPNELTITPTSSHPAYSLLTKAAERHAAEEGFDKLGSADAYWRRSDHMNFAVNLHIPVAFLFADVHEDYHKVTDTPDKIDYDKASRVVRLVLRMLEDLQVDQPAF